MQDSPSKTASLSFERDLWAKGYRCIAGIDEAGRGAWAGPVYAAAVCLPPDRDDLLVVLEGVRDSKQLTARARESLVQRIQTTALCWGIGSADHDEIDRLGIVPATRLAMVRALNAARCTADFLLIDKIRWPGLEQPHLALVRGDQLSLSIAAASVLGKVARDDFMRTIDKQHPAYGFALHKGYGTQAHQKALAEHGACPFHRMSFAPLKALLHEQKRLPDL